MANPYRNNQDYTFWRRAVSGRAPGDIDPVVRTPFRLATQDRIATAGSCFAQHISRTLQQQGFHYLVTERGPASAGAMDENYATYPARFGNVYTVRQLLQLFERAFGLFDPLDRAWATGSGGFIDPFRPRIQHGGFASIDALEDDRSVHLRSVQEMFETCNVFVFTLGLTEGWASSHDGAVVPLAPGTVTEAADDASYRFHNFSVGEMEADFRRFLSLLRHVNPTVKVILTVSPVALVATYEDQHVLVSNTYSKSALRVVAEAISTTVPDVAYFPSYEIITGAPSRSSFLADDLRDVTEAGVAHVMSIFSRHFLATESTSPETRGIASRPPASRSELAASVAVQESLIRNQQGVVCDEEAIEPAQ